jgi:hypothetical protein
MCSNLCSKYQIFLPLSIKLYLRKLTTQAKLNQTNKYYNFDKSNLLHYWQYGYLFLVEERSFLLIPLVGFEGQE